MAIACLGISSLKALLFQCMMLSAFYACNETVSLNYSSSGKDLKVSNSITVLRHTPSIKEVNHQLCNAMMKAPVRKRTCTGREREAILFALTMEEYYKVFVFLKSL